MIRIGFIQRLRITVPFIVLVFAVICEAGFIEQTKHQEETSEVKTRLDRSANIGSKWKITGCGKRNPNGILSSYDGAGKVGKANFGEFPWMAALPILDADTTSEYMFDCGASLIHPRVAVTGGKCAERRNIMEVRAGDWNIRTTNETLPYQQKKVAKVILHEDIYYRRRDRKNDIALLILEEEFAEADNIGVICLPPPGPEAPINRCVFSGWGSTPSGQRANVLKKVELPIVDRESCKKQLASVNKLIELHESFICAGGEYGKDACQGDSGAPLACPYEVTGKYMLSGIVSWGLGCGTTIPGAYSNVAYHRKWIDEKLQENNIDMAQFTLDVLPY